MPKPANRFREPAPLVVWMMAVFGVAMWQGLVWAGIGAQLLPASVRVHLRPAFVLGVVVAVAVAVTVVLARRRVVRARQRSAVVARWRVVRAGLRSARGSGELHRDVDEMGS